MDNRQASAYVDRMFGTRRGYVAVAVKHGNAWEEKQFAWPAKRDQLLAYAERNSQGNVFICPALRRKARRVKGDGINLKWLWADIDWDKVPASKVDSVKRRIAQMGSILVDSGTVSGPEPNVHVYVRLNREVSAEDHARLNLGLRMYLYGDAKHTDNSLLRLPGTDNKKPSATSVRIRRGNGKMRDPDALLRLPTFAKVVMSTPAEGGTAVAWSKVDVSNVPRSLVRKTRWSEEEALGRFNGKRHAAVWGVTGDLFHAGLTDDQIHTLMHDFPAALAKAEDEHGGYDVHADVERRLSTLRHAQAMLDGNPVYKDDESPFEELTDEQVRQFGTDNPLVQKLLKEREARRMADQIEAERRFIAPPPDVSWSVAERRKMNVEPMRYLISELCGVKHNVVLTAQYKVGKTAFMLATLAKSLVDGEKFLGRFAVPEDGRVVGHWNCEMDETELFTDYIEPSNIQNPERLHVANLRGYGVNVLSDTGKAWAVQWLKSRGVQVWTIDSLARILRMAGVSENDNQDVLAVLMAIDEIKRMADVDVSFIIAHTGRAEQEEGRERARGAASIDEWCDARWVMVRDGEGRFLSVEGRGVALPSTVLDFNRETRGSTLGIGDRHDVRASGQVHVVTEIVTANSGIARAELVKRVCASLKVRQDRARELIKEADDVGLIRVEAVKSTRGGRSSFKHFPVVSGEKRGNATVRMMDMRRV